METQNIFKGIEETGERFKKEFVILAKKAQIMIESKVNSAKFEASYKLSVDDNTRKRTMNELKKIREDLWRESLEKAQGDFTLAFSFYEKTCDFP